MEENIVEKLSSEMCEKMAEELDDVAMRYFITPRWIADRKWLYKIYARLNRFEIREDLGYGKIEFWIRNKKVGEAIKNSPRIKINI